MKATLLAGMRIICITWHCAIIIILGECGLGLVQLVTMQKEIQKQMTVMVAVPVAKEGKRMEGILLFGNSTSLVGLLLDVLCK
jgi:hypothetical protein